MEMYEVESSFIAAIGYDPTIRTLRVAMYDGEDTTYVRTYDYYKVPMIRYAGFWEADSKGVYYNRYIMGKYESEEVDIDTLSLGTDTNPIDLKQLAANIIDEAIDRLKSWV